MWNHTAKQMKRSEAKQKRALQQAMARWSRGELSTVFIKLREHAACETAGFRGDIRAAAGFRNRGLLAAFIRWHEKSTEQHAMRAAAYNALGRHTPPACFLKPYLWRSDLIIGTIQSPPELLSVVVPPFTDSFCRFVHRRVYLAFYILRQHSISEAHCPRGTLVLHSLLLHPLLLHLLEGAVASALPPLMVSSHWVLPCLV